MNIFHEDFLDFLSALSEAKVDYILVGGYSVVLHGYLRTTGDLDVWIQPESENYDRLMLAFQQFGLPVTAITREQFLDPGLVDVFTFGRAPLALDLMTKVKGLEFNKAFDRAEVHEFEGIPVRYLHMSDLIDAKRSAGRYKDLDDLEQLEKLKDG